MKKRVVSILLALMLVAGILLPGQTRAQAAGTKLVALTFDDGPGKYTNNLLDGLAARGVQATFFNLGMRAESYPDVVKRIYTEGHQLCSHAYDHKNLPDLGTGGAIDQVNKTNDILNRITGGKEIYALRAPYGNTNSSIREKLKCPVIYWSVDPEDWKNRNATYVKNSIVNNTFDGAIILVHDIYSTTVEGALAAVDELQKRGYEFVTIRELFRRRGVEMQNGTVYYSCKPRGTDLGPLEKPVISIEAAPGGGAKVTISASGNVPVYYTLDGSPIGYGSPVYNGPFVVNGSCTIRAVAAYHLNGGRSAEVTYKYTLPPATKAQISVADDMLSFSGIPAEETVYFTVDGSDPTVSGQAYAEPVPIQRGVSVAFFTTGSGKVPTGVTRLHYSMQGNLFADVTPKAWYYDAVDSVTALGYMNGVGDYAFAPNSKLNRAMTITILYRMSGAPVPQGRTNRFADVKDGEYYAEAVEWGFANGVISGVSPTAFEPNRNITRQELAQMMINYLRYAGADLPENAAGAANIYKDRSRISKWAIPNVEIVTKIGLMLGNDKGNFCPQDTATRAEGATVLFRMHQFLNGN